jgi:DNA-binding CsgD family transcriptional regulator
MSMAQAIIGSAWLFEDYGRGCRHLEHQLALARRSGDEQNVANLGAYLGACSVELHAFRPAERYLAESIAETADRGLDLFLHFMQAWRALAHVYLGRWAEADSAARSLREPETTAIGRIAALAALARLHARRGDPGPNTALAETLALATATGSFAHLGLAHAAAAEAAWLAGDHDATRQSIAAVYALALRRQHAWFAGELAYWAWRLGEPVDRPPWLAAPFALEMAGDWRAAAAAWERLGCPYEQARALAAGDTAAQTAALLLFDSVGAGPAAEAVRQRLHAAGAPAPRRPRPATRANPYRLTARELDVWRLLADDLTNAEIAVRLHLSPKTVNHHVSAVLAKLQVPTRHAAAALARQQPEDLHK